MDGSLMSDQSSEHVMATTSPAGAHAAILAGHVVRVVVGADPEDPILLHYLDRCYEDYHQPMIYTEAIGGWSEGVKEAICEPDSDFYVRFISDPPPLSITIVDLEPPQREEQRDA